MAYYGADFHFGHKNIIEYCARPFSSVEEMDEALIAEINACDEELWILGDFSFYNRSKTAKILDQIDTPLVLVRGNHDSNATVSEFEERGFPVLRLWRGHIAERAVQMSHYPYQGDSHEEDRFEDRRPKDKGEVLVHGHVHDKWKIKGRQINVGWDAWHKILTYQDLDFSIRSMVR